MACCLHTARQSLSLPTGARLLHGWAPVALTARKRPVLLAWLIQAMSPGHVASDAIPLTFSCSRWWSRSLRTRSSCPRGASLCRR